MKGNLARRPIGVYRVILALLPDVGRPRTSNPNRTTDRLCQ